MEDQVRRRWQWFRNRVLPYFGLAAAIVLIGFAVRAAWPRANHSDTLTITGGDRFGTRAKIAGLLRDEAKKARITLKLDESAGSNQALQRVNSRKIDLALVQGGLVADDYPNVRRVATLNVEPLHLLVRREIYDAVNEHIGALRGKSINVSVVGSGTHKLSMELIDFLRIEKDFVRKEYRYDQLMDPDFGDLPDAVFTVSSLPSPVADYLIRERGYRLIALPYAESVYLNWLDSSDQNDVNRRRLESARIPAFVYKIDPPVPSENLETIGTRLELVAHKSVADATIDSLCKIVYESDFKKISTDKIEAKLLRSESTFKLHPGSQEYVDRMQPVSAGRVIELTEQLVGIGGAALGGLLFFWQWLRRVRERRRDREFVGCIERVVEIENQALRFEQDDAMSVSDLEKLQDELGTIKTELIQQYRQGYLEGSDMLSSFLKHANDASELISRIVLHETEPKKRQE